jgi:ATP-dependent Zn protease
VRHHRVFDGGYLVLNSRKRRVIVVVVVVGCLLLYSIFHSMRSNKVTELSYSDLMDRVNNIEVATAIVEPENISCQLTDKTRYSSKFYGRSMALDLADRMNKQGVKVSMNSASSGGLWVTTLIAFTPFHLIEDCANKRSL